MLASGAMPINSKHQPTSAIDMTNHGADVLVCLINGSAFQSRYPLLQHRLLAQLRAVECRKAFLRCAATGETCLITTIGVKADSLALQEPGTLVVHAPLLPGQTVYTQMPWLGNSLVACAILIWGALRLKHRARKLLSRRWLARMRAKHSFRLSAVK